MPIRVHHNEYIIIPFQQFFRRSHEQEMPGLVWSPRLVVTAQTSGRSQPNAGISWTKGESYARMYDS